jgi:hypothetical protein
MLTPDIVQHGAAHLDEQLRDASMHTLWRLVQILRARWMHIPYGCELVAYVWRLVERVSVLAARSGDAREFNHPLYTERAADSRTEHIVNERFLVETERTFFAIESRIRRCSVLAWPTPTQPRIFSEKTLRLRADALERFESFITRQLAQQRFRQFISKDFEVVFYDHVLRPGEMEIFEQVRPYDDRKPLSCISRMRRFDFDAYQKLYVQPAIGDVWSKFMTTTSDSTDTLFERTHPAYMLIAILL